MNIHTWITETVGQVKASPFLGYPPPALRICRPTSWKRSPDKTSVLSPWERAGVRAHESNYPALILSTVARLKRSIGGKTARYCNSSCTGVNQL